jgi:diguanylate cyclase (GGDEF)-like protein
MLKPETAAAAEAAPYVFTFLGGVAMSAIFKRKRNKRLSNQVKTLQGDVQYAFQKAEEARTGEAEAKKAAREAEERASKSEEMAHIDHLTGLPNVRAFTNAAERHRAHIQRHPDQESGCILLVDIDHFKRVNDTLGHKAGDEVLQKTALTMERQLRESDTMAARIGGEEFGVLATDVNSQGALALANRLRESIKADGGVTISIGIAPFEPDTPLDALKERADTALYAAKENGRDRVEVYDPSMPLKSDRG